MNCPKCGSPVSSRKQYCDNCGTDISVYRKIIRLSNKYYNSGLEKAKVRDLSGAAADLRKSLQINKKNIDARNLLGLVCYEMGETVEALSEWVISKNFRSEDNAAEVLLEKVQDDPAALDNINQAIKKYNIALQAAREQNDDMAILQLKKVIGLHGNFLRALQLISLLLIKTGEDEKARKYLEKARAIDVSNTTTLKYLAEIEKNTDKPADGKYWENDNRHENSDPGRGIAALGSYREDKPNVMVFINLMLGVLIGIAVVYYLIVPTVRNNVREEYEAQKVDYSSELSSKSATITQQEKKIESLNKQVNELLDQLNSIDTTPVQIEVGTESYNALFNVIKEYKELKAGEYTDDELQSLALDLWSIDTNGIDNDYAISMLENMRDEIYPLTARKIYKSGKELYENGDYEAAVGMLEAAVAFNPESDSAMYYLGKAYQALEDYDKAVYYYNLMLEVCPNSALKEYIPQRLRECGVTG